MDSFKDISIIVAVLNLIAIVGNMVSSFRLNSIKNKDAISDFWKNECSKKDQQLKDLQEVLTESQRKKNQYKMQFLQQLKINTELEGQIRAYKQFHKHE